MNTDDPWRTPTSLVLELSSSDSSSAWQDFTGRYHPFLQTLFRRLGFQGVDAEELATDVILEFRRGIGSFHYDRSKGGLRAFLRRVCRRRAIDRWRKEAARGGEFLVDMGDGGPEGQSDPFERRWSEEWYKYVIYRAIDRLSERRKLDPSSRSVLFECYYHQREDSEAARILERPVQDIWRIKSRWRDDLKAAVREIRDEEG